MSNNSIYYDLSFITRQKYDIIYIVMFRHQKLGSDILKAKDFIVFVLVIIIIFLSWICYSGYFKKPQKVITIKKTIEKTEIDWQKENIVFLGDSITEIYPIQEIFGNLPIVRSGVSGYRTKDKNNRRIS